MIMRLLRTLFVFTMLFGLYSSVEQEVYANDRYVVDCVEGKDCDELEQQPLLHEQSPPLTEAKSAPTLGTYVRVVLAFAFVVGLLYVLAKFVNQKRHGFSDAKLMRNLGGVSVGQQKSIQLISIGGRYYIIGVGEDVRLLKEIETEEEIATIRSYVEREQTYEESAGSLAILERWKQLGQRKKKAEPPPFRDEPFDLLFQQELQKVQKERKEKMEEMMKEERERRD